MADDCDNISGAWQHWLLQPTSTTVAVLLALQIGTLTFALYLFTSLREMRRSGREGRSPRVVATQGAEIKDKPGHATFAVTRLSKDEMRHNSQEFFQTMKQRRSVRFFSKDKPPREVLEKCIEAASTR